MIYFIQRSSDDFIIFGHTDNIQETLFNLSVDINNESKLIGLIPDSVYSSTEIKQKFTKLELDNNLNLWIKPSNEIFEFLDEVATLDEDLKPSEQYKASEYTPIKQQALEAALTQQIDLVVTITGKWQNPKTYLYFDLNAGPGVTDTGHVGSPLVFRRIANEFSSIYPYFKYKARLYEIDPRMYTKLIRHIGADRNFRVENCSHEAIGEVLKSALSKPFNQRKWVFGAIYLDPSNAQIPWELLEQANEVFPHIDIMINIACASYKRTIATEGYETLAEKLPRIKKHWIVRRPFGKHQWSILIGTNWENYPAWQEKDFYPWNDQSVGTAIFEKLVYTSGQLRNKRQPRLL